MEEPRFSHHDDQGYLTGQRESHWLPALRPDTDEDVSSEPHLIDEKQETVRSGAQDLSSSRRLNAISSDAYAPSQIATDKTSKIYLEEEDGRLDPAWGFGIGRADSTHFLDSVKRSSSFPSNTDGDEMGNAIEASTNGFSSHQEELNFNTLLNGAPLATDLALEIHPQRTEDDGLDTPPHEQSVGLGQHTDVLSDNRFEEGIPLIATAELPESIEPALTQDSSQVNAFEQSDEENDEASFFAQIQNQTSEDVIQPDLERKSTQDVLGPLHLAKHETAFDTLESPSQFQFSAPNTELQVGTVHDTELSHDGMTNDEDSKWAAVLDDDEFLVEDADDLLPDSDPGSPSSFIAASKDESAVPPTSLNDLPSPSGFQQQRSNMPQTPSNPYAPHQPSTSDMAQLSPKVHGNVGFTRPGLAPMGSFQNHLQQPTIVSRAESFADQAKGGYKSPYDLPMELAKPKKRPQTQRIMSQSQQGVPPPPRSSSMSSQKELQSPFSPTNATFGQNFGAAVQPPAIGSRITSAPVSSAVVPPRQSSTSSFFEELPIMSKPRPAPNTGRYTPSQSMVASPPQVPPASPPRQRQPSDQFAASPPQVTDPYSQFQLRPPERIDPFTNVAIQPPSLAAPSATINRYSPAPSTLSGAPRPTASPRYSPAPPTQPPAGVGRYASQPNTAPPSQTTNRYSTLPVQAPPSTNATQPFSPRTSSPLAYQNKPPIEQTNNLMPPPPLPRATQSSQSVPAMLSPPRQSTPPAVPPPQSNHLTFSPPKPSDVTGHTGFVPPRRSQTQSPSRQVPRSAIPVSIDNENSRPASAYSHVPLLRSSTQTELTATARVTGRTKTTAPELDFEQPQDETQNDQLQRWRGAPIFRFGFGGVVVSSFPKHTPRYKAGHIKPQIRPTTGEVKLRTTKDLSLLPDHVTKFPGPLKGKSKKKDLLNWMGSTIMKLENDAPIMLGAAQTLPDPRKCHEELILLWKIVKIIVENDGVIENKPEALKAFNTILSPEVHAIDESTASQYRGDEELTGIYHPSGTAARSDSVDPLALENLRKHLLKGEREQAIWKAADSRLWSHALLIASTIRDDRKLWKQVVQEFVRQEVKPTGNNSESLSALYEIFGGNMEESIDQLVPPSARAGLQMVSKVDTAGPTKNALDGLDRWKETLTLVLNNRTPEDQRALATLGSLLGSYGRVQAAHICFLFARNPMSPNVFGDISDPQASITLLSSDQRGKPFSFHQDQDALLLTEAYEFAISTLAPASMSVSLPHLSAYKLQRALDLADNGFKIEAQSYCDAIASGITTKTKISPYYHASLLVEVEELAKRLKQVPVQSTSWMAKPSVEKATSSLLSKLSNFVAGDDSDAESKGSAAEIGPFAKTSGSPNLSRTASQTDLHGSYHAMTAAMPVTAASSRYAPGGISSPRSSSDMTRGRPSLDSQRSPPTTSHGYEPRQPTHAPSSIVNQSNQSPARSISSYQPYGTSPGRSNYQPTPSQPSYMPDPNSSQPMFVPHEQISQSYISGGPADDQPSYMPTQPEQDTQQLPPQPAFGGYTPPVESLQNPSVPQPEEPASSGYGYEPPADTGYVPYQPDPESDDDDVKKQKPKKKSYMDLGQDNFQRISPQAADFSATPQDDSSAITRKKANDEAADAAFRAAAEADAQRAKEQAAQKKASGSWLGGWFGGKKADNSLDTAPSKSSGGSEPKVFKAKLGEDKMKLYYDKDLKKWVNPDNPDSLTAKTSTPPPPPGRSPARPMSGGPPRASSTPAPVTTGSRASTPASMAGAEGSGLGAASTLPPSVNAGLGLPSGVGGSSAPPSATGTPAPPAVVGGLAPPSRPVSNSNSIDDLIGPATGARKGGKSARGAKKGRYVDVMAP